jgi:hypothetical protein
VKLADTPTQASVCTGAAAGFAGEVPGAAIGSKEATRQSPKTGSFGAEAQPAIAPSAISRAAENL